MKGVSTSGAPWPEDHRTTASFGVWPLHVGPEAWQVTAPWQGEVKAMGMAEWAGVLPTSAWSPEKPQPRGPGGVRGQVEDSVAKLVSLGTC